MSAYLHYRFTREDGHTYVIRNIGPVVAIEEAKNEAAWTAQNVEAQCTFPAAIAYVFTADPLGNLTSKEQ